ncbi:MULTISPECIES: histidine triad nucleotide-binding protein [unclassified Campylobacter]|uniref:histidine triad nucleotide-binding protein n=1 Tax=unclassified Campylobacter TaxID=2593542 RepID=UPI001237F784|nr:MULTISPECIES: histidine triad nucleotide-binding protein [unclassified Campylobacter]KAA6224809.1 histidine triad nucleotide-binding protein [Campylobacter sp. LR185c]KAA6227384.1 histidine triad nucleotide-binding protein [Campylobacter sp. LR196d]KAA6228761.1 histidine triad nucleotide-binding protein [Campylobacter sp. LR286c]KAA6229571.1 histidine triad nucleotide-binding protein [Campylobacter sp. LR264d]KAA6230815.1 histidine triad nucleotide-binding protein [Campylobacter sp. LR291e]
MREKTIFELIIEGKLPSNKVLEDNDFLAFHDIHPRAPIHILIIPKKHFKDFQEFKPELMAKMTKFIQELAVLLGVDKSGYRLITNCGKNSGQEVFHLHFHLLGGMKLPHDKEEKANPQTLF